MKVYMTCIHIDLQYKFKKVCDRAGALKFLIKCCHSPTVRVIAYLTDSPTCDADIEYWFAQQIQEVLPILQYILHFPFYNKEV